MTLLTLSETREIVETDLSDVALQAQIDAAEQTITDRYGPNAADGDITYVRGLNLPRKAASITSVTLDNEVVPPEQVTLVGESVIEITPARYYTKVVVVYTPKDLDATRKLVQGELIALRTAYTPAQSVSVGGLSQTRANPEYEEVQILRRLNGENARHW